MPGFSSGPPQLEDICGMERLNRSDSTSAHVDQGAAYVVTIGSRMSHKLTVSQLVPARVSSRKALKL